MINIAAKIRTISETTKLSGNKFYPWLRFLTEIDTDTKEAPAELMENADTRKALSIVEESAMTEGQIYAYERFWQSIVNERVLIQKVEQKVKRKVVLRRESRMPVA